MNEDYMKFMAMVFRDTFSAYPAGIADWASEKGIDMDEFIQWLNHYWPEEKS